MPRHASTDPSESLELFLDTISNVFGGVLFVAMLVVLMLQVTPEERTREASSGANVTQDLTQALEQLEAQRVDAALRAELESIVQRQEALQAEVAARQVEAEARRKREADAAAELVRLRSEMERERQALAAQEQALAAAQAKRDGVVRLPRFRTTAKQEVPLLVAGGRVATLFNYDPSGRVVAVNEADVEVTDDRRRVRPREGQGLAVTPAFAEQVARQITAGLLPQRHFIGLGVYEDAFAEGAALRDAIVALGFEYGLVLLPRDATVAIGAEGGVQ